MGGRGCVRLQSWGSLGGSQIGVRWISVDNAFSKNAQCLRWRITCMGQDGSHKVGTYIYVLDISSHHYQST